MTIILCAAISLDGKIADKHHSVDWISQEDQTHLKKIIRECDVLIMGRITYENYQHRISPKYKKKRVIITSEPQKHLSESSEYITFTDQSPSNIINSLRKEKYTNILVLGGSHVFSSFINADLYDRLLLTIEPIILGSGINFLAQEVNFTNIQLIKTSQLNKSGTLLLEYKKNCTNSVSNTVQ